MGQMLLRLWTFTVVLVLGEKWSEKLYSCGEITIYSIFQNLAFENPDPLVIQTKFVCGLPAQF